MRGECSSRMNLGLRHGEAIEVRVRGLCMRGLEDGARIRIRRRRFYLPGDIVMVRRMDHWNIHRLLGVAPGRRGWLVLTSADYGARHDPPRPLQELVGRVEQSVTLQDRLRALGGYVRVSVERVLAWRS